MGIVTSQFSKNGGNARRIGRICLVREFRKRRINHGNEEKQRVL